MAARVRWLLRSCAWLKLVGPPPARWRCNLGPGPALPAPALPAPDLAAPPEGERPPRAPSDPTRQGWRLPWPAGGRLDRALRGAARRGAVLDAASTACPSLAGPR